MILYVRIIQYSKRKKKSKFFRFRQQTRRLVIKLMVSKTQSDEYDENSSEFPFHALNSYSRKDCTVYKQHVGRIACYLFILFFLLGPSPMTNFHSKPQLQQLVEKFHKNPYLVQCQLHSIHIYFRIDWYGGNAIRTTNN